LFAQAQNSSLAAADIEARYQAEYVPPLEDYEALAMQPHVLLFVPLGFGGKAEIEAEDYGPPVSSDSDLLTTYGIAVRLELPIHLYAGLGLFASYSAWLTDVLDDAGYARSSLIDLGAFAKVRLPFAGGGRGHGEAYVGAPIGLCVSMITSDMEDQFQEALPGETFAIDTGTGMAVGVFGGVQYFFAPQLGAVVEVGWLRHSASHQLEGTSVGESNTGDFDLLMSQIAVNVGAAFIL
jgi:hypothetical protein